MKLKNGCNAAWYELNISAPDDCVSACCYYLGEKDSWSDEFRSLDDYWNSPNMQKIREMNSTRESELTGGCAGCYFFGHRGESGSYFPNFLQPYTDLSPAQEANWLAAIDDYNNGSKRIKSTPLRFYINFGFGCNLACTMCHQVPRRKTHKKQVNTDILLKWKPYLKSALNITVIGGEPFVLPEAVKFIQAVINDPELEDVELTINTNGTLLHKHLDMLAKKRKLQLAVSLDTIGEEFEKIRVGASWKQVERNIQDFLALGKQLGFPWVVGVPCLLLKTNIPRLPDFVDWTIANDVQPGFYNFIDATGIEKTFEEENVVSHPQLLQQVPDWERYFIIAVDKLRNSKWAIVADQLDNLYIQIRQNLSEFEAKKVEKLQTELKQVKAELEQSRSQLQPTQAQLEQLRAEKEQLQGVITAMESTKFWKLRTAWFGLKRSIGLVKKTQQQVMTNL